MAIRFTPELNSRISKTVRNYNTRVRRANVEGKIRKDNLPEQISIKMLKKSYSRRADLERELKNLETFNRKSVRQESDGINKYETSIIEKNRKSAIKYWEQQASYAKAKAEQNYPLQKNRYNEIVRNLNILKKKPSDASPVELQAMYNYVDRYRKSFERQATGYRGFLGEVDAVMERLEYSKDERDRVFNKLSELEPHQLYYLYETSDVIGKIYELADSPKTTGGKLVLHDDEASARTHIDTLLEKIDIMVQEAKEQ